MAYQPFGAVLKNVPTEKSNDSKPKTIVIHKKKRKPKQQTGLGSKKSINTKKKSKKASIKQQLCQNFALRNSKYAKT